MEKHEANPHLHNALGQAYQRRHQYELAVRHFQRTTELSPTLAAAFNNLGSALFTIAPAEEALKAYDRALELAPEMIAAWMNRAIATYSDEDVTSSLETVAANLEVQKTPIAEVYHGIFTHQKDPDSDLPDPEQWDDPEARSLASSYAYLASLNPTALLCNQRDIHRLAVEASPESGLVAEFGVFYGHSIRFLAECIATPIHGFDSFEGIPEGWFQGEDAGPTARRVKFPRSRSM